MKMLLGALALIALTGCTSTATTYEQAKTVPAQRALAYQAAPSGEHGEVLVTRDGGVLGSACYIGVYVNGTFAARLGPGERVKFLLPVGENLVGSGSDRNGNGLCAIDGTALREVQANVRQGQSKRFRISGDMNAGFSIAPSSF